MARDLAKRGHSVDAIDASPTLVRHARASGGGPRWLVGDAAALPFGDGSFDVVVAYNSLTDLEDMPGSIAEASRVLRPGGRLCICITHPIADAGSFDERLAGAAFTISGTYLGSRPFEQTVERAGLSMSFGGWAYPLEEYTRAVEAAGFLIEIIREPPASRKAIERDPSLERWARIPNFLFLRAVRADRS